MSLIYCENHDVMVDTDYDVDHFLAEAEEGIAKVEENNEELRAILEGRTEEEEGQE